MALNRMNGTGSEHGAQGKRHAACIPHLIDCCRNKLRKSLTIVIRRTREPIPAGLNKLTVGLLETWGTDYITLSVYGRPSLIAHNIQGR